MSLKSSLIASCLALMAVFVACGNPDPEPNETLSPAEPLVLKKGLILETADGYFLSAWGDDWSIFTRVILGGGRGMLRRDDESVVLYGRDAGLYVANSGGIKYHWVETGSAQPVAKIASRPDATTRALYLKAAEASLIRTGADWTLTIKSITDTEQARRVEGTIHLKVEIPKP